MAFDITSIQNSLQLPPRIVVYGVPGIGKTTLAASAPSAVFIPVEDGLGVINAACFPRPDKFENVLDCIDALINEEHSFKTLVIDSLDRLEPMIWSHVCETVPTEKGATVERIEQYGYGKGYVHALNEWRNLLSGLDVLREQKKMSIILIAHSQIVRHDPPDMDSYERYQLRLHKLADAAVCDWSDVVAFANYKVSVVNGTGDRRRAVGKGERALNCNERPSYKAKNRYGIPDGIEMNWEAMASHFPNNESSVTKKSKKEKA